MEVVKGKFGQDGESGLTMIEALTEGVKNAGWEDVKGGRFFLVMDSEDSMSFVTNEIQPAEVVMMLEIVKTAIVSNQ